MGFGFSIATISFEELWRKFEQPFEGYTPIQIAKRNDK